MALKTGLELELFLIDTQGNVSNRADDVLADERLQGIAVPESNHSLIEIHTTPSDDAVSMAQNLTHNVGAVYDVASEQGLFLLPSTTIGNPQIQGRNVDRYAAKEAILGNKAKSLEYHIGGTHLHADRGEDIPAQYRLFYAADPSFAFMSSTPFIQGVNSHHDHRVLAYRNRVFKDHPDYGRLHAPTKNPEAIFAQLYDKWAHMCEAKGVSSDDFTAFNTYWGPVRFSKHTIESRAPDNNLVSNVSAFNTLYLGLNRQLENGKEFTYSLSEKEHEKLVRAGTKEGLKNNNLHAYLSRLSEFAKEGLSDEEKTLLAPVDRMLETRHTFSDDLTQYAKSNGLYSGKRISEDSARQVRLYAAQQFGDDLHANRNIYG